MRSFRTRTCAIRNGRGDRTFCGLCFLANAVDVMFGMRGKAHDVNPSYGCCVSRAQVHRQHSTCIRPRAAS